MVRHRLSIIVLLLVAFVGAPTAEARKPALMLGQISSFEHAASRHQHALREALRQELAVAHPQTSEGEETLIVHARLRVLRTEQKPLTQTRCTVSLMLLGADSGSLFGTAESKVTVKERRADQGERLAIQAAAKGALGSLLTTLDARRVGADR